MLERLAALLPRARVQRTTLVFRNPVHAIRIVHAGRAASRALEPARWVLGLGAAMLMLPLGLWLGRRTAG